MRRKKAQWKKISPLQSSYVLYGYIKRGKCLTPKPPPPKKNNEKPPARGRKETAVTGEKAKTDH